MSETQLRLYAEARARDDALDKLQEHRGEHISVAKSIADSICRKQGQVTSTEVIQSMRDCRPELLEDVDLRFMGCVFRGKGWRRVGYTDTGSHRRLVSIWTRTYDD